MSRASKKKKKEYLFKFSRSAFSSASKMNQSFVVCPICGDPFEDINMLTLEHVPPLSIGGKDIVLTCKNCNPKAGHSVDAELSNQKKINNFFIKTEKPTKAKFNILGIQLNTYVTTAEPMKLEIKFALKNNNPEAIQKFENLAHNMIINNSWDKCKFQITPNVSVDQRLANIGYLKSAFLLCFAKFGYRYAFHKKLHDVRLQIKYPKEKILDNFYYNSQDKNLKDNVIILITEPFHVVCVQFGSRIVFLPFMNSKENVYLLVNQLVKNKETYRGILFDYPERPEFYFDFIN